MRGIGLGIPGPVGAISEEEMLGLLRPYQRPEPGPLAGILGPSVGQRMGEADASQRARWAAGERSPTPLTEDNMWLADDVAGSFVGPLGMAGIFAGVGARTANRSALEMAERMAKEGADPRAIWRDTGWFQGPDQKWRWEIDDSGMRLQGAAADVAETGRGHVLTTVDRAVDHPGLMNAYPDRPFKGDLSMERGTDGGSYTPGPDGITIRAPSSTEARSTTLHELQHAVQEREGFARGANVGEYASGPMFDQRARDLQADLSQNLTGGITARPPEIIDSLKYGNPQEIAEIARRHGFASTDEAIAFLRHQDERRTPFGQYQRTAGEAEARAVQARRDMTPEQRRATFPMDSYDVPQNELIVRGIMDNGPQMSAGPDLPEQIAGLLREGRASEVTDEMLGRLDPNQNRRLVELYEQGATGMPMPMDEAARMGRAAEQGYAPGMFHGTASDIHAFQPPDARNSLGTHMGTAEAANERLGGRHSALTKRMMEKHGQMDPENIMPLVRRNESPLAMDDLVHWMPEDVAAQANYIRATGDAPIGDIPHRSLHGSKFYDNRDIVRGIEDGGHTGIRYTNAVEDAGSTSEIVFDPANIRSRFARFDPRLARNANLLASMGGAGLLGYGMAPGQEDDIDPEFIRLFGR
jgi:hypothetical protein